MAAFLGANRHTPIAPTAECLVLKLHPISSVAARLTVYVDPYGRFFLGEPRAAYPVNVESIEGYRVIEEPTGRRVLVGPAGSCWR